MQKSLDEQYNEFAKEDNKYFKWYWNICERARNRELPEGTYIERHHVYPKSIYGEEGELVKLTAREHYICHLLIWVGFREKYRREDDRTRKMNLAFTYMNTNCPSRQMYDSKLYSYLTLAYKEKGHSDETKAKISESNRKRTISEESKKKNSESNKKNWLNEDFRKKQTEIINIHHFKNISDEHRKKLSDLNKGEGNTFFGKTHSEETKQIIREKNTGRKCTEEEKLKMSISHKGKIRTEEHKKNLSNALKGRKHSDEHRKHNSEAQKGKKRSEEAKRKTSETLKQTWKAKKENKLKINKNYV